MAQQDELIRDIHKEIQQEKWLRFWKNYRVWLIFALLFLLTLVVATGFWLYQERANKQNASSLLLNTLYLVDKANSTRDETSNKIWQDLETILLDTDQRKWPIQTLNYTVNLVHYYITNKQPEKALTILEKIPPVEIPYFDKLLTLLKGQAHVMAKNPEKAEQLLTSLADSRILSQASGTSVWGYLALEWLAELAWQESDKTLTLIHLKTLSDDPLTPPAIRKRATRMLQILS